MLVCLIYLVLILKKGVLCIRLKHGKTGQTCFEEFAKDKKKKERNHLHIRRLYVLLLLQRATAHLSRGAILSFG